MTAPDSTSPNRPKTPFLWEALGVGLVGVVATLGLLWWAFRPPPSESTRPRASIPFEGVLGGQLVGNDACRECHPSETALHARHGHSRTLRPAEDRLLAQQLVNRQIEDPEQPGVFWTYHLEDDGLYVERTDGTKVDRAPVQFAFGSGYHATTFLTVLDPESEQRHALEHRLTYYADTDQIGITPGQTRFDSRPGRDVLGRVLDRIDALNCFECHVTIPSGDDLDTLDVTTMVPTITCERCHGPGREHIEKARQGVHPDELAMPFGPDRWTVESQMELCGKCHRHPDQAPPGHIYPQNRELARFQPVGLMQSACYTQSEGALSCVTCHDPHTRPSADPAYYEAACLSCHQPAHDPRQVACSVSPRTGCIDCHMPRVDAGQNVLYSDHWIRVRDDIPHQPTRD